MSRRRFRLHNPDSESGPGVLASAARLDPVGLLLIGLGAWAAWWLYSSLQTQPLLSTGGQGLISSGTPTVFNVGPTFDEGAQQTAATGGAGGGVTW
jgi:hypothetical protein